MDNKIIKTAHTFLDIIKSESIRGVFDKTVSELAGLLSGNPVSYYLVFREVKHINISEWFFYSKLDKFFRGIEDIPLDERVRFISDNINGKEYEFANRVLTNINLIDEEDKATLISNLQRALFYDDIDLGIYFRLINAVRNVSLEDLYYLSHNQNKDEFGINVSVDFLYKAGLMYSHSFGRTAYGTTQMSSVYKISKLGELLIEHCLNYGDAPQILEDNITFYSKRDIDIEDTTVNTDGTPVIPF